MNWQIQFQRQTSVCGAFRPESGVLPAALVGAVEVSLTSTRISLQSTGLYTRLQNIHPLLEEQQVPEIAKPKPLVNYDSELS